MNKRKLIRLIKPIPKPRFERFILAGACLYLAGEVCATITSDQLSFDELAVLSWNYAGSPLPPFLLDCLYWLTTIFYWVGLGTFLRFQPIGRSLLLTVTVIWNVTGPLIGWRTFPPFWTAIGHTGDAIILVLLVLSYFPPHSAYFGDQPVETADASTESDERRV